MNTFIQWQETISDTYLTDTPPYFPFIELDISLLPQESLASIPSNALINNEAMSPVPSSQSIAESWSKNTPLPYMLISIEDQEKQHDFNGLCIHVYMERGLQHSREDMMKSYNFHRSPETARF